MICYQIYKKDFYARFCYAFAMLCQLSKLIGMFVFMQNLATRWLHVPNPVGPHNTTHVNPHSHADTGEGYPRDSVIPRGCR